MKLVPEINREKIKQAVVLYQEKQFMADFINGVGDGTYSAAEVWSILDLVYDIGGLNKLDFKDLY